MLFQFGGICVAIFGFVLEASVSATFNSKDFVCQPIKSFDRFFGFSSITNLATASVPSVSSNNKKQATQNFSLIITRTRTFCKQQHQPLAPIPLHPFVVLSTCMHFSCINLQPAAPNLSFFTIFSCVHCAASSGGTVKQIVTFNSGTQRDSFALALRGVDWLTSVFLRTSVACTHDGCN
jgi:hypothetical protein